MRIKSISKKNRGVNVGALEKKEDTEFSAANLGKVKKTRDQLGRMHPYRRKIVYKHNYKPYYTLNIRVDEINNKKKLCDFVYKRFGECWSVIKRFRPVFKGKAFICFQHIIVADIKLKGLGSNYRIERFKVGSICNFWFWNKPNEFLDKIISEQKLINA